MRALTYDEMVSNLKFPFHQAIEHGVTQLRAQCSRDAGIQASSVAALGSHVPNSDGAVGDIEQDVIYHLKGLVL